MKSIPEVRITRVRIKSFKQMKDESIASQQERKATMKMR